MRLASIVGFALLVLASLARGAEARDCRDETPLPADVRLIVPGADVPPDAARFAGAWVGPWKTATGDIGCGTLVPCQPGASMRGRPTSSALRGHAKLNARHLPIASRGSG